MIDKVEIEDMPIPPFLEGKPTKLIVGTFPPNRNKWDFDFFFPNLQNRLWNTLGRVAYDNEGYETNKKLDNAIEERKQILRELNSGMVNIIKVCERKNGGSLDNDLVVKLKHDILEDILKPNPTITAIFLTSASGRNSCLSLLKEQLNSNQIDFLLSLPFSKSREEKIRNPFYGSFYYNGINISVYLLYSPSPTSTRAGIREDVLFMQYKNIK